jgi:cellobiose epimerase
MSSQITADFAEQVHQQLFGHILPFWMGPALDHEHGGWLAWMSNDLRADRTQPKGLILNCRILWTFSAVYRIQPEAIYRQMAERAFEVVMHSFWDGGDGGAYWQLSDRGEVLDDSKKTYGQAFYIYALAEYFRSFADPVALARACRLFEFVEQHAHDPRHAGYWEVRRRDWSETADTRLSDKDMNEMKSMNNHLHLLEAFANLYRVWKEPRVKERLIELIKLFDERILDPRTHHLRHFFDEAWQIRSKTYTFGHDIEASWLLCEAANALNDAALLERTQEIALAIAARVFDEGRAPDGGLYYEGQQGTIVDARTEWWPQAEAVVGFLAAFELSGEKKYWHAAQQAWQYIEDHFVDREHGDWFWRINEDGKPDTSLPKISEWKGPYHTSRACLEVLRRLKLLNSKQCES